MGQKAKTEFRIVGGDGHWIAYHTSLNPAWGPHQVSHIVRSRKWRDRKILAVQGRSPTEALHRLKRQLVAA